MRQNLILTVASDLLTIVCLKSVLLSTNRSIQWKKFRPDRWINIEAQWLHQRLLLAFPLRVRREHLLPLLIVEVKAFFCFHTVQKRVSILVVPLWLDNCLDRHLRERCFLAVEQVSLVHSSGPFVWIYFTQIWLSGGTYWAQRGRPLRRQCLPDVVRAMHCLILTQMEGVATSANLLVKAFVKLAGWLVAHSRWKRGLNRSVKGLARVDDSLFQTKNFERLRKLLLTSINLLGKLLKALRFIFDLMWL